ncbi:hypothetical protein AAKU52_002109 [Pedobacter sp. CG_S7]|uniref:hypothetical protein n=1 Tax=Pedobacter sp. CG_S7 TaxID=3143930 RepID=UPI003397A6DD
MKLNYSKFIGKLWLVNTFILLSSIVNAQTDSLRKNMISGIIKNLELRQSFGSAATKKEPARFHFTLPKGAQDSYLIDAAVGIPFFDVALTKQLTITGKIIGELHRNTLFDESQYTWLTGFSSTLRTKIHRNQTNTTYSRFIFTPTFKYSRNVIDTVNAFVFTMDIIPFRSAEKGINLSTYTIRGSRRLINLVSIIPAVELQNNFSANNKFNNGTVLRPVLKLQYSLGGNKKRIPAALMVEPLKTWETSIDYTLRYALINSTISKEKYTNLLKTAVDYYFATAPVSIAFGVSFNYGSDPLQGLKKQQYWLATLSIQK